MVLTVAGLYTHSIEPGRNVCPLQSSFARYIAFLHTKTLVHFAHREFAHSLPERRPI